MDRMCILFCLVHTDGTKESVRGRAIENWVLRTNRKVLAYGNARDFEVN